MKGSGSHSGEFSMRMPVYEEYVNFESYTCASLSIFQSIYDFLISLKPKKNH